MVCCNSLLVMGARATTVALVGLTGIAMIPSLSLAQYPGSASDLDTVGFAASSSTSSGSSSESSSGSASSSGGMSSDGYGVGSVSDSMASSGSSAEGDDGHDGYGGNTTAALTTKKAVRKRALIRQFRLEFAKTLAIDAGNKLPLQALSADVYLDQFSKELDSGLDQEADVNSLGSDLGVLRSALDHRLDEVIASYNGETPRRGFFSRTTSAGGSAPTLRAEIQRLKLKHELLKFGEYSLQAMGYYAN